MLSFRTVFRTSITIKNFNLFSIPVRYFPRKTKTSTIYNINPLEEKKLNPMKPQIIEKERGVYQDETRQKVPPYLPDEIKFEELMAKDFTAEKEMKETAKRIQAEAKTKSLVDIVKEKETKEFVTQDFDRFEEHFVNLYKEKKRLDLIKQEKDKEANPTTNFEVETFTQTERLSKRLSRLGVCSRRQAERLIEQGMIKVDGTVVDQNVGVNDSNYIQIGAKTGIYTPTKQNTRIWLYNKPQGLICTRYDPEHRKTIFEMLPALGLRIPHVLAIGRLDFLSEGLMILTNDGDLKRALELPSSKIERSYRVRVFGRMFSEEKLTMLRQGFTISSSRNRNRKDSSESSSKKDKKFGPYIVEIIRRQNTNTWLHMKLFEGKNNEIRRAMRKFSLRVNRLVRTSYGPYTIKMVPNPNDLVEVKMTKELKALMYKYYKEKTAESQSLLSQQKAAHVLSDRNNQKTIQSSDSEDSDLQIEEGALDIDEDEREVSGLGEKLIVDTSSKFGNK